MTIFTVAYSVYFAIGAINVVPLRGEVDSNALLVAALGLLGLLSGASCSRIVTSRWKTTITLNYSEPPGHKALARAAGTIGLLATSSILWIQSGIPLFLGDARHQIPGLLSLLAYGLVIASVLVGGTGVVAGSLRLLLLSALCAALAVLMGYRTMSVLAFATVFIFGLLIGKYRLRVFHVIIGSCLLFALSWIAVFRFNAGTDAWINQFRVLGLPEELVPYIPVWATPREGVAVFNMLLQIFPDQLAHTDGSVLWSEFTSLLPGGQEGPRLMIASYIGGRDGITITPSIIGQPYVDFGLFGVVVFMGAVGFLLQASDFWQRRSQSWAPPMAYAFGLSALLASIHSGLLDFQIIVTGAVLFAWAAKAERRLKRATPPARPYVNTRLQT